MDITIDYDLKSKIELENLGKNNAAYRVIDMTERIIKKIAIGLFIFNLVFYFLFPNSSIENMFVRSTSGINIAGVIVLIFIECNTVFFAVGFSMMMKYAVKAFLPIIALSKMDESMNIIDNKLICSYKQNIFSPFNQRTFLAIDLSRIYSIDYDESSHEIVIDGYMEEKTIEYSPVLETVKFEEMRHNTTKLYDYYSPSLYVILNQYK